MTGKYGVDPRTGEPLVVTVLGLKKSGKTTVVEGIVAELKRRGFLTGTVKSMLHSSFSFDVRGKDTFRHGGAGADFVISLSRDQTVYLEHGTRGRRDLKDVSRFFPSGAQFVICEGVGDPGGVMPQILALRGPEQFAETLEVRMIEPKNVIGISGLAASVHREIDGIPAYDIMDPSSRSALCDLILTIAGDPDPFGTPGGPLIDDPGWRPGVLPPGIFPEIPYSDP